MDSISVWAIIAQLINFWIIFFIFKYFLWEKIVSIIEERRKNMKASADAENIAKERMEAARAEAQIIVDEARTKASEIESRAEKESEYLLENARNQIEKDKLDMENNMKSKILDLSLKLNSKIFNKETANKDFMEKEYDLLVK